MPKKAKWGVAKTDQLNAVPNLNHLSWDDIRVFLACTKEPSFRQAAKKLQISASTVVRRIDQLESALGIRLFDRLPEGVVPTPDAKVIIESAQNMERSLFELMQNKLQYDDQVKGRVSLSVTEGLGAYWVVPRLIEFQQQYPNLIFDIQCSMNSVDVLRLEADMAVQFIRPSNPDLIITKLGRLHVYPFASQNYLDTYGHPKDLDDVKNHRFVQQIASQLDEKVWAAKLGYEDADEITGFRTNSSTALLYAIERDGGIGALATYASALKAPVVPVDIGIRHSMDIWLTYHPSVKKTPHKAIVIKWLKSIFDPQIYPWFRDEFIHPNQLSELLPKEAEINVNQDYFAVKPF